MFEWLHLLPEATCQRVTDDLLASAREMAKRDVWEACHFAIFLRTFECFNTSKVY